MTPKNTIHLTIHESELIEAINLESKKEGYPLHFWIKMKLAELLKCPIYDKSIKQTKKIRIM